MNTNTEVSKLINDVEDLGYEYHDIKLLPDGRILDIIDGVRYNDLVSWAMSVVGDDYESHKPEKITKFKTFDDC